MKGKGQAAVQMFRYADDWILVIRGTKAQAQNIKEACRTFLRDEMGLELSEETTSPMDFDPDAVQWTASNRSTNFVGQKRDTDG